MNGYISFVIYLFLLFIVGVEVAPECKTSCSTDSDGKTKKCTTSCTGMMPGTTSRSTGLLDKACVEECNGGPVHNLEELKPECEQKCPFKQPQQIMSKKTEFSTLDACLKYCQEKGLGKSEQECHDQCKEAPGGMTGMKKPQ
uniref:Uncharacterized protein n=1 Tax=Ditylenchus dipsaci TaxID=166011 RepID=A0A915ESY4_9BILA